MLDISKMSKTEVLQRLYAEAKPQGLGWFQHERGGLSQEQAEEILKQSTYFDYLLGCVMKVDLSGDTLDPRLYDRDNGTGAAARALGLQE